MTVAPPSTSRPRRRAGPGGRVALTPSVTWRDGVHVTGTMLWFDARRAREVCVVSSIDRVARAGQAGHGQLIATAPTLAMLGVAGGAHGVGGGVALATPTRRPFTLGQVQLELVPSGHTLGAYTPEILKPPPGSEVVDDWRVYWGIAQRLEIDRGRRQVQRAG